MAKKTKTEVISKSIRVISGILTCNCGENTRWIVTDDNVIACDVCGEHYKMSLKASNWKRFKP